METERSLRIHKNTPLAPPLRNRRRVVFYAFDVADGRITRIWAVRNPEKLRPWHAR